MPPNYGEPMVFTLSLPSGPKELLRRQQFESVIYEVLVKTLLPVVWGNDNPQVRQPTTVHVWFALLSHIATLG